MSRLDDVMREFRERYPDFSRFADEATPTWEDNAYGRTWYTASYNDGGIPFPYREAIPMIQFFDRNKELVGEPVYGKSPAGRTPPRGAKFYRQLIVYTPPKIRNFGKRSPGA